MSTPTIDIDALLAPAPVKKKYCKVGKFLTLLPDGAREQFAARLTDPANWSNLDLVRSMTAAGYPISDMSILRHRDGDCPCFRNRT